MFTKFKKGSIWCYPNGVKDVLMQDKMVIIISSDSINSRSNYINVASVTLTDRGYGIQVSLNTPIIVGEGSDAFTIKDKLYIQTSIQKSLNVKHLTEYIGTVDDDIIRKINDKLASQFDINTGNTIAIDKIKKYADLYIEEKSKDVNISLKTFLQEIDNKINHLYNIPSIPTPTKVIEINDADVTPKKAKSTEISPRTGKPKRKYTKLGNQPEGTYRICNTYLTMDAMKDIMSNLDDREMLITKYNLESRTHLSKIVYHIKKKYITT